MAHAWILDVLEDLKSFAVQHDMERLTEQLDDTLGVASVDLAAASGDARGIKRNGPKLACVHGTHRTG